MNEIAVTAKWHGSFTEGWPTIRSCISRENCLTNIPGKNDIQKLKAWAETQGLFMDFDIEVGGFSSEIRTLTFRSGRQAVRDAGIGPPDATEERANLDITRVVEDAGGDSVGGAVEDTVCEDIDRQSISGGGGGDDETWGNMAEDVENRLIGIPCEMHPDEDTRHFEDASTQSAITR